jgi:hypothetical protein
VREGAYHLDCRSISSECEDRIVCGSVRCGELRTLEPRRDAGFTMRSTRVNCTSQY